jgi:hypothetical protein
MFVEEFKPNHFGNKDLVEKKKRILGKELNPGFSQIKSD